MSDTTDRLKELTGNAHTLVTLMVKGARGKLPLFAIAGVYDPDTNDAQAVTLGWAGEPKANSRADIIARYKTAQVLCAPRSAIMALSPLWMLGLGPEYDYPGGIMMLVDGWRYTVACSGQSGHTDLLVASTALYGMSHEVKFNHIGFSYPDEETWNKAVAEYESHYRVKGIRSVSGSGDSFHYRCYLPIQDPLSPMGWWFIELRWFPERTSIEPVVHFDVVTPDPKELLTFVGTCVQSFPEFWDDAPKGTPVGMVAVDNDGPKVGLMARKNEWFDPRD